MGSTTELTAALHDLALATGQAPDHLPSLLDALVDSLRGAVRSFLGLELLLAGGATPVRLTRWPAVGEATTSLHVPVLALTGGAGGAFTFWASTPGAFVDLAADLCHALHLGPAEVVLDAHLPPPSQHDDLRGLVEATQVDRAIGVLLARGHTVASARAELEASARRLGVSLVQRAVQVVADVG
ncbi:hypothetical protein [Auraticoccus monumenti]|uniref:ANTAR domain-containing protein n=1 Tax=Auraticoccus monumenti TaxID=675864 RepID=A0A1G7BWL5_9ACTN|nr:hypothetical protein [Auraticoccus monumenti]SDE31413.1 hypothetical protein SAMN04489747_3090 [Auraticoccus monumenti]